jgi:hypothetical protein
MKTTRILIPLCLLCAALLPVVAQAQFTFTTNNGAITITGYTGSGGDVTIPSMTNGWPVTSIGNNAYKTNANLISVTIPNTVSNIGINAFAFCYRLTNLTIGTNVTSLGSYAFEYCTNLTSVTIPNSVTSIGSYAFDDCSGLTSVTIPNSVTNIGSWAFAFCLGLTSVTIPNSVTSIGSYAFYECVDYYGTGLKTVCFLGNAPGAGTDSTVFYGDNTATVYYLPGTKGWGLTFDGRPTALWFLPNPQILNQSPGFGVKSNQFGFTISWATNISVVVEGCTNLVNPVWTPVTTNALVNGTNYFSDPQWTNYPARFYRITSP